MKGTWIRRPIGSLSIVFVHGILSDGKTCWTHSNGTYWPQLLAREEQLSSSGIYVFEYKTGFFSGTYRLGDVVDAFRTSLRLDAVQESQKLVFVCHSMGGIVARRYVVQNALELVIDKKEIGLFLIASPSLGAAYANWLAPLARLARHSQADALRFAQDNAWLMDLDTDFRNLKEAGRLNLQGKELVEDTFVVLRSWGWRQVVEPFSGARYFGDALKIPNSDHFSIANVADTKATQHQLLVEFLIRFVPDADKRARSLSDGTCRIRFGDKIAADIVACQLAIRRLAKTDDPVEILWPDATIEFADALHELIAQVPTYYKPTSIFHGADPRELAEFATSGTSTLDSVGRIRAGAGEQARKLVKSMIPYWTETLDNVIAETLANFLTLCNCEMISNVLYCFRFRQIYKDYFPKEYETWFTTDRYNRYREIFSILDEVCSAKLSNVSGRCLPGIYFWGPRSELLASSRWRPGDAISTTWFDKYLIPQNELRLLEQGSDEFFRYDEKIEVIKVVDNDGLEIG
jgi:hypothetical protein